MFQHKKRLTALGSVLLLFLATVTSTSGAAAGGPCPDRYGRRNSPKGAVRTRLGHQVRPHGLPEKAENR
jgi:hypothetical protein